MTLGQKQFPVCIAGIDYSMSSPAICVGAVHPDGTILDDDLMMSGLVHTKKATSGTHVSMCRYDDVAFPDYGGDDIKRFDNLGSWALDFLIHASKQLEAINMYVFVEDYAYASSGRVFHIGENGGILKYKLMHSKFPYMVVSPSSIKKFATGQGNATKNKMYDIYRDECSIDIENEINYTKSQVTNPLEDLVDAYWIFRWGVSWYVTNYLAQTS